MRIRISFAVVLAVLLVPAALFAQSTATTAKPAAISVSLVYFEDLSGTFDIKDAAGASTGAQEGDELKVGWTVVTGKGDLAELKVNHTGTIIKVGQNTNFKLEQLRSASGGQDVFSLGLGKIRTVAGKASGKDQYQIKTQSAVCGVRGSDVVVEYLEGATAKLSTLEGTGWIQNLQSGESLDVGQGFFADALAEAFKAFEIPADLFSSLMDEMKFNKLDVNQTLEINKAYQASLTGDQGQAVTQPEPAATAPTTPPPPQTNAFLDGIMAKLREILGMEIGSITIAGTTWAKVVIQPTFSLGALKMALYLPIIYNGDMFNPADYYKPAGNDEWDFGGLLRKYDPKDPNDTPDPTSPLLIAGDFAQDLLLKIKYMEWGKQRDPFFFKVGNLNDVTIGHGLIMRDFANDADFPAVRRVGVNVGLDFTGFGLEAMVNDAGAPSIFGGRLYIRPIPGFRAALGLSGLVDWNPGKDWTGGAAKVGDPLFINTGLDLDIPFVESDFISIVAFADGAVMVPYFRSVPTDASYSSFKQGLALNAVYDPATAATSKVPIKNWGVAAGLFGNLIIKDFTWRLEFRDYTGSFQPQFYNSGYERLRTQYLSGVLDYLNNPNASSYDVQTMGIFGEGGLTLPKLFSLKLSYFWPWSQDAAGGFTFGNDHLVAKFTLEKGVIPVVNIWGTVAYERTNFAPTIMQKGAGAGLSLFDANTVVSATVNYPVSPMLDVTLLYTMTAQRDSSGNLVPSDNPLLPKMDSSVAIQTSVHL
jgi:hypothetical protein